MVRNKSQPLYSVKKKGSVYLSLNPSKRKEKAKNIINIVLNNKNSQTLNILDIGTGYGIIASELSKKFTSVTSVDIVDERLAKKGYKYVQYDGKKLPFKDNEFDVVILNHVLEHVYNQDLIIKEIYRVLNLKGICYVAVPNKLALLEPHFKIYFLSWLPQIISNMLVRINHKSDFYDVRPHTLLGYKKILTKKFSVKNVTYETILNIKNGKFTYHSNLIKYIPVFFIRLGLFLSPTFIFILKKP